jgi:hypothetical protein
MLPIFVIVTGSPTDPRFAVTEFPLVGHGSTKFFRPPFQSDPIGCVVACSGKLAAVGGYGQDEVWIYDLTNPSSPTLIQTLDTQLGAGYNLSGVGTVSLDGTNLLVGEAAGPNIKLMDINSGTIKASCAADDFADGGVLSLALKGNTAIVSGQFNFDIVGYDGSPTLTTLPYISGASIGHVEFQGPIVCDFDGATAVLGDGSGKVYAFSIAGGVVKAFLGGGATAGPVSSVTVSGDQIAAGSVPNIWVALISLPPASGSGLALISNAGGNSGGAVKFWGRANLACSTNNGTGLTFFGTSMWATPVTLGYAAGANLNSTLWPTMGFTEVQPFKPLPIPPWMEPIVKKLFG